MTRKGRPLVYRPSSSRCPCSDRRQFLLHGGLAAGTVLLGNLFPGRVAAEDADRQAEIAPFPRQTVVALADLKQDQPIEFRYPKGMEHNGMMLVKLGARAGGGVGPDQDVVAFSTVCTHMGGSLDGLYRPEHKVLGPCPEHLTSFDLTRHGMVVAGHATQALTQVLLELDGGLVLAVGLVGLLYGHHVNTPPREAQP